MIDLKELTVANVRAAVQAHYYNNRTASAEEIQNVLDRIESEPNERLRSMCYAEATQHCTRAMRSLINTSKWRANKKWAEIEAASKK